MEESKFKFLENELTELIKKFDKESKGHKTLYRRLRCCAIGLTVFSTILAAVALQFGQYQWFVNIAIVIVTSIVNFLTYYEGLRKPFELWIGEKHIYHLLKDLNRKLHFDILENPDLNIEPYFREMSEILSRSSEDWRKFQQKDKEPSK
jgi:hypothetical protein